LIAGAIFSNWQSPIPVCEAVIVSPTWRTIKTSITVPTVRDIL
jgi:hypothetical protein